MTATNEELIAEARAVAYGRVASARADSDRLLGRLADALEAADENLAALVIGGAESVEWEYRIAHRDGIRYTRARSEAKRALLKGADVRRRVPERPAGSWQPVPDEEGVHQ